MPTAMRSLDIDTTATSDVGFPAVFRPSFYLGLAIAAVLPALFWTLVLAYACKLMGINLSAGSLIVVATLIAGFLTVIFAALASPKIAQQPRSF